MVGSLMYAMLATRPDLATAVSVVSKFLSNPKDTHIKLVKQIYKYLRSHLDYGLVYKKSGSVNLTGYADASYANEEKCASRSGYGFMLGKSLISWYSGSQPVIAQSSAEAEYYAAGFAANEAIWLKQLLESLGFSQETITIYEDNLACIALTKNPQFHKKTKHIQVKYHVIRQYVENQILKFIYIPTKDQLADMFTKGLPGCKLRSILTSIGLYRKGES